MFRISSLMPQQITVSASIIHRFIRGIGTFANGQGYGSIRIGSFNCFDNVDHDSIGEKGVFAALQDKSAETKLIAALATG